MKGRSWLAWATIWGGLFCAVTLLVQARLLAPLDVAGLGVVAGHRQLGLSDGMNWVFRLGFASVDAVVALLWALWLGLKWRHRGGKTGTLLGPFAPRIPPSLGATPVAVLAPLMLFGVVGVQAGLRLVIDQPAAGKAYELQRAFAGEPVSAVLDRSDAAARGAFEAASSAAADSAAATPPATGSASVGRGSYPSGHAARTLFLALLAADFLLRSKPGSSRFGAVVAIGLFLLSGLVGYSALYFGYHWPSDLLGGYLLALAAYPVAGRLLATGRAG